MNFQNVEFLISAAAPKDFPKNRLPEIAFAGKSNVGKSSVINRLLQRKNFARVGDKPGKTIHVNYFVLDRKCYLVDLPGYGFAKVDKQEKARWGKMMQDYFEQADELRHVLCLVDIRHEPTEDDKQMNLFLRQMGIPFTVIATKADKISRGARMKQIAPICRALLVQPWEILCYSSENGQGRSELLGMLGGLLQKPEELLPEEEPEEEADAAEEADDSAE